MSLTKMPENIKEFRSIVKESMLSIVRNIPRPSSKVNGYVTNVEAEQPVKFSLMMRHSAAMLRPHYIDRDISKMSKSMIGHDRGLQN